MHLDRFVLDANERINSGYYHRDDVKLASHGSLKDAINHAVEGFPVIAEVKPRSPSEGRILNRPVGELVSHYSWGGACAISVLTDSDHFDGSLSNLREAHSAKVPLLFKDFVIDETQLDCAAHHGASAVLLIERILAPERREVLVAAAHERGLEVLLEVCDEAETSQAVDSAADIIGVNARDLSTLKVDTAGASRIVASLAGSGKTVIALSGIKTRQDCADAFDAGAVATLVGSSLVKSADPGLALRALRRPLAKVCGLTQDDDVKFAASCGADLAGFVVGANSPRAIAPVVAQRLADHARAAGLRAVLVTPHEDLYEVREWCRVVKPDYVQVHGQQPDPEWMHTLQAIPTLPVLATAPGIVDAAGFAGIVFDTPRADGTTGGTGATHDWNATAMAAANIPCWSLVAGGLGPENVAAALNATGCTGADASSGLEASPGTKDQARIAAFVTAVHEAT